MEEEQIFNHLDDLNKKHQHITSMQKQEDKEIEEMNRIQSYQSFATLFLGE